jgi:hypothetical protein
MSKVKYEDGYLIVPIAGFEIKLEVLPVIRVDPKLYNGEVSLHANVNSGDSCIKEGPKAIKTQEDLNIYLAKEPTLPSHWKYDDLLLGFIYSTQEDPENYNWFLQTRFKGKFGGRLTTSTNVNVRCPFSTVSWLEGGNWHGRFCFTKNDIKNIERVGTDLNVVGKTCGEHEIGDLAEIPEGADRIVISYNIHKNKWYLHYQKQGLEIKTTEIDGILADCPMQGNVDRNHTKPKVTQFIKVEDIAHLKIMSNMAIIYGK